MIPSIPVETSNRRVSGVMITQGFGAGARRRARLIALHVDLLEQAERVRRIRERDAALIGQTPHPVLRVLSVVGMFHFVCIGWVLFLRDLDKAWTIIARLLLRAVFTRPWSPERSRSCASLSSDRSV